MASTDLAHARSALLGVIERRARRMFFDWFSEHSFAIADYTKAGPPRPVLAMEPIRITVWLGPTVET
jgi:hypothetical protein